MFYKGWGRQIEIGAEVRLTITTGASVKKKVKKQEIRCKNKKTCYRPD